MAGRGGLGARGEGWDERFAGGGGGRGRGIFECPPGVAPGCDVAARCASGGIRGRWRDEIADDGLHDVGGGGRAWFSGWKQNGSSNSQEVFVGAALAGAGSARSPRGQAADLAA